ncbi:T9SS type A sorting domain-containing protein [bacterium]|nr:T9SS type A sorting domain-containing protein [bacterium]
MKKKIKCFCVLLCCCGLCTAQQVVSSGGYAKHSEASIDWIIGGSLSDLSGYNLGNFASEQMKELMESAFSMNVYPNPATDVLNVEITPSDTGRMLIEMFDLTGRAVLNKMVVTEPLTQLDIKDLPEGAFYLKITQLNNDQLFKTEKIIKIKN